MIQKRKNERTKKILLGLLLGVIVVTVVKSMDKSILKVVILKDVQPVEDKL